MARDQRAGWDRGSARVWRFRVLVRVLAVALAAVGVSAGSAWGEQASEPSSPAAGLLDTGAFDSCAVVVGDGSLRCWGLGSSGELGYGSTANVGDVDTPGDVGPVNLGGHAVRAVAAGDFHTCAILDDGSVRCWGFGNDGRLGYRNTSSVSDPSTVGAVNLSGHTAKAITAGGAHTCAILDDGTVRCWGYGGNGYPRGDGRLGYGNTNNVLDPGLVGPVPLGYGVTAVAITAGDAHTCAILENGDVRCWGYGAWGQLGYGSTTDVGSTPTTTPNYFGPVNLSGHRATAISAGGNHTCVVLDDGSVRCWGSGVYGELGYGSTMNVGDNTGDTPDLVGSVPLGAKAIAVSAGSDHTCAILVDGSVRCWGWAEFGRLGYPTLDSYGNQPNVGATPSSTPDTTGPVDLGAGRTAVAISAGGEHTCARLDDGSVRCWGHGSYGQLGYCNTGSVGETNTPGSVGPVNLQPGDAGATCPTAGAPPPTMSPPPLLTPAPTPAPTPTPTPTPTPGTQRPPPLAALRAQRQRARALHRCLTAAARLPKRERADASENCIHHDGRAPGAITGLVAGALSQHVIELVFTAPGTDGDRPPPANGYLIKQSRRPIRNDRQFDRAPTLCAGDCVFEVTNVGDIVFLTVTGLRANTTYYYALRARDNISPLCGPRSRTVHATTGEVPDPGGSGIHMHGSPNPPALLSHRAGACQG